MKKRNGEERKLENVERERGSGAESPRVAKTVALFIGHLLATDLLKRQARKDCSRITETNLNHTHFLKSLVNACEIFSDFLITSRYVGADNVSVIKAQFINDD